MRSDRKRVEQLIRSMKADFALPEGLADRVRAALAAMPRRQQPRRPRLAAMRRLMYASAAVVAVAVLAAALLRPSNDRRPVAPAPLVRGVEHLPSAQATPAPKVAGIPTAESARGVDRTPAPGAGRKTGGGETSAPARIATEKPPIESLVAVIAARQPATDGSGRALKIGDRRPSGTVVRTGPGGRATLITRRGSELALDANSALALSRDGRSAALRRGRLYCRNRMKEFAAITTDAGRIELLGTTVDAAVKDKQTVAVTVVEGKVRLANAHGEALVAAGKKALLVASLPPGTGDPVNTLAETAWYDSQRALVSDLGDIMYTVQRDTGPIVELWVMNADGTGKHRVISHVGATSILGSWVPGEQVIMVSTWCPIVTVPHYKARRATTGSGGSLIAPWNKTRMLNIATGENMPLELPTGFGNADGITLSPDGARAGFYGSRSTGPDALKDYERGIYVCDLQTHDVSLVMKGNWDSPAWSPDGKMLAVSQMWTSREGHKLMLVNANDGTVTDPHARGTDAAFSPDGKNIAYVDDYQGDYGDGTEISNVGRIYVLNLAAGAAPRLVSPRNERAGEPHWSPDGTRVLYTVLVKGAQGYVWPHPYNVLVSAADGSGTTQVYHSDKWPRPAWLPASDAIDILTSDGVVRVAPDGSGVLADLGGNESDSPLSPAEKRQMGIARSSAEEAIFQFVVGRVLEYEGKIAEARAAYRAAAGLFAGLPWQCPLLNFNGDDVTVYADTLVGLVNRSEATVQADVCQSRLTYLSLLLPWYAKEHGGAYPSDLARLAPWAATKVSIIDHIMEIRDPAVMAAMLKCPLGEAFIYTPPAPGGEPKAGDVILRCPQHPESRVVWEQGRAKLRLKPLKGYSITNSSGDI